MARTGTANLGAMVTGQDRSYWNSQTPSALLGIRGGTAVRGAAGASLPPVTAGYGDRQQVWWSPDSPTFWVFALIGLTAFGMAGADVRVRLFKRRARAEVGTT